jgi:hypothetical protein
MKKTIVVLVFLAACAAAWSQSSLLSSNSFGIFTNELDAAITALEPSSGPGFSKLGHDYLLAGLANYDLFAAAGGGGAPYLGYYSKAPLPWSIFGWASFTNIAAEASGTNTANTTATAGPFGAPPNTYSYEYLTQSIATTYDASRQFSRMQTFLQFLISIGAMTTGLVVNPDIRDSATAANNTTVVTSIYYLTNVPAAGTPPTTALAYSLTTQNISKLDAGAPASQLWTITVPFAIALAGTQQYAELSAEIAGYDYGTSVTREYSTKASPGPLTVAGYTMEDTTTAKRSPMQYTLSYTGLFPGLLPGDPRNQLTGSLSASIGLQGGAYGTLEEVVDTNLPGSGGANTNANLDTTEELYTLGMTLSGGVTARAAHSLYFALGESATFGVFPALDLEWRTEPSSANTVPLTQLITNTGTDVNANGSTGDAGDTLTVQTDAFTNAVINVVTSAIGSAATTGTVTITASLPVALQIKPKGWPFGFTLGAKPSLGYSVACTQTSPYSFTRTTQDYAAGVLTSTDLDTTNSIPATAPAPTHTATWTSNVQTLICLNIVFDPVAIDISLNAGNLLDFENLVIQATIPLR